MKFLDLSTDVLAIKCIKNYVFIGIGCMLYIVKKKDSKIVNKIDALHPDNIHHINVKDNKLIIYGRKSLCIFNFNITDDFVDIKKFNEIHRFKDWIIHVKWLESLTDSFLTILFAHNNVFNYDFHKKQYSNTTCKETCLLYAGSISGQNYENAIVLSGTVFQEILIWKIKNKSNNEHSEVLHRLKGHKGVIFSVFYDSLNNLICSTSDDRTVRLWKVFNESAPDKKSIDWENTEISLQATMYGHLARVWKAILLKNTIASIGEDSRICFWSLSGELLHKIEAHQGAPIWCIDMSEDDIVYTGGADGSVNSWPLTSIKSHMQNHTLLGDDNDIIPKQITFLADSDILIYSNLNNSSKILHFNKNEYQLVNSYDLPEYSSTYFIMELSMNKNVIALASIKGDVTLYKKIDNIWRQTETYKIVNSKIFSIQWLDNNISLICAAEGILYVIKFLASGIEILSQHMLPPSRERWVTAACIHNNLLICGDRMGSIFIYKLENNAEDPLQSFKKIHGRLGVQSCTIMNSNLITTGRDGTLRFYKFCDIHSENPRVEFLYAKNMPMDWVSRLLRHHNDYYVLGFKEEDFVIYSTYLKRFLVKIPCGGGHRSWDCMILNKIINFVYIQKRKVHVVTIPLDSLFIPPLMIGSHIKEIYSIKTIPLLSKHHVLVSGGEDCILHINYINSSSSKTELNLKIMDSFDGHLSSIKCISVFTLILDENISKHLIFSGGGRAQLKIWEITIKTDESIFSNQNISCKDLLSYMLHGPDKERNKIWIGKELMYNADPETRYMDLTTIRHPQKLDRILIFIACSDGYLRTLNYSITSNEVQLIDTLPYKNRCILKVHSFMHDENILLMTMATDGLLNFWKIIVNNDTIVVQNVLIDGKESFNLHQSGINSFDIKVLNDSEYLLATGGDDNLLNLLIFKVILVEKQNVSIQINSSWKTASVHYAQITGIKILDNNKIYSVGADQKLAIHEYSFCNTKIHAILLEEKTLCISDIQGITFCNNQRNDAELFCIYGKGYQLLQN